VVYLPSIHIPIAAGIGGFEASTYPAGVTLFHKTQRSIHGK